LTVEPKSKQHRTNKIGGYTWTEKERGELTGNLYDRHKDSLSGLETTRS